jgi:hypothetical protein
VRRIHLAVLIISPLLVFGAFGRAHGIFSGLSNMIGNSQAIVVASVESLPKTPRTHSGNSSAVQSVRVLYVLNGNFTPQEQIDVALDSEILFPARTYLRLDDFPLGERYVLFIAVDSLSPWGYAIVNAAARSGSHASQTSHC